MLGTINTMMGLSCVCLAVLNYVSQSSTSHVFPIRAEKDDFLGGAES